tara:strand:- start:42 stop:578 length:537 start_codon:yes stop_codon:yes gene_type:complete
MDSSYKKHDDKDKMEEMAYKKDDLEENLYEEEALYEEEEMGDEDMGDEDMDEADVEMDEELVQKFMDAVDTMKEVADVLGGVAGGDMDLGDDMDMGDDKPADDMDMGGDEEPMELDAGGEEPAGEEDEEEMLQEALRGISYVPSKKEVVKVVAKRVAKRLQEAKRAQAKLNKALGKKH